MQSLLIDLLFFFLNKTKTFLYGPHALENRFIRYFRDCPLPRATMEGDVILLDTTGAYGASMESSYNLRPRAASLFLLHNS